LKIYPLSDDLVYISLALSDYSFKIPASILLKSAMAQFNLVHCISENPCFHGLNGYKEVIESLDWGLKELGHDSHYSVNTITSDAINILFGAQVLSLEALQALPENSIIYNFEQMRGLEKYQVRVQAQFIATKFMIWDYSKANLDPWKMLGATNVKIVPIAYAPILTRILKPAEQDIDVLLYGISGGKRLEAFQILSQAGLKVMFFSGLYGDARDQLIARSKIILNVNLYNFAQIFEIVRVSYLLANRKAVVSVIDQNTFFEEDLSKSIHLTSMDNLLNDCLLLLQNTSARESLENSGYAFFTSKTIIRTLSKALIP